MLGHRAAGFPGVLWLVGPAKMGSDFQLRKPRGFIHWGVNNLLQTAPTALVGYNKNKTKQTQKGRKLGGDRGRDIGESWKEGMWNAYKQDTMYACADL